jgi:hypothetical protein
MYLQSFMTLENNDLEDIESFNLPSCIVVKIDSNFIIREANLLFINLLKKKSGAVLGKAIDDIFPKSLEFKYYPHQNSLIEGLEEASASNAIIQIIPEHFVLSINNNEAFEINKWALNITPVHDKENETGSLIVSVLE